jgi:4-aminobutyrate aminotransferase
VNESRLPSAEGDVNVSPARAEWRASLCDAARAALDEDERYFLRQSLSTPCLAPIVHAEGAVLTGVDGRRTFDFHGNSVHQLGHGHPKVVAAIRREMEVLPFCPRRFANATALARRLVETAPGDLNKVLFAPSGAAAISMALKLARYATGGTRPFRSGTRFTAPIWTQSASAARRCSAAGSGP